MLVAGVFAVQLGVGVALGSAVFSPGGVTHEQAPTEAARDAYSDVIEADRAGLSSRVETTRPRPSASIEGEDRPAREDIPVPQQRLVPVEEEVDGAEGGDEGRAVDAGPPHAYPAEAIEAQPGPGFLTDEIDLSVPRPASPTESEVLAMVVSPGPVQVFPVVGGGSFSSTFGAPRDGGTRQHKGNDIFAERMTPVIAVASGTVVNASRQVGDGCCWIKIRHDDGSQTLYIHLNNDTPGTDDGQGWGIADGIEKGARVEVGDVIGFVGDSGNAESTSPHLHFEYHPPGTNAVDPYELLATAPVMTGVGVSLETLTATPAQLPNTGVRMSAVAILATALILTGMTGLAGARLWGRTRS